MAQNAGIIAPAHCSMGFEMAPKIAEQTLQASKYPANK